MTSLQKLMSEKAMGRKEEESITPDTRYRFEEEYSAFLDSWVVWIVWTTANQEYKWQWSNHRFNSRHDVNEKMAKFTAEMLNYAAFCQNCSSLEVCPTMN